MLSIVIFIALVSSALAQSSYGGDGLSFQGLFSGQCGNDGFYYMDADSYVMCSNGNAYRQRCAPGSKNSAPGSYTVGQAAGATAFCDVNLVDVGYTLQFANNVKGGYGPNQGGSGYGVGFNQLNAGGYGGFAGGKGSGFSGGFGRFGGFNNGGFNRFAGSGFGNFGSLGGYAGGNTGNFGSRGGYAGGNKGNFGSFGGFAGRNTGYGSGFGGITFAQLGQPANKFGIGAGGLSGYSSGGTAGVASFGLLGGQKRTAGFAGGQKLKH